jgi:hypothetical protein
MKVVTMKAIKVGIREFRSELAGFIAANTPVAVTRHGHTVGYFIPTHGPSQDDVQALAQAGAALDRVLQAHQAHEELLVADFKDLRHDQHTPSSLV